MSEYQYYEFQAINRPLDRAAQEMLRLISSRARITAASFTNHYERGGLKGDPRKFMGRWFDLHFARSLHPRRNSAPPAPCEDERRRLPRLVKTRRRSGGKPNGAAAEEAERARRARIMALKQRGEGVWRDIEAEIERRNASGYEKAASLLSDLHELAAEAGSQSEFANRLASIRTRHEKKARLIARLEGLAERR